MVASVDSLATDSLCNVTTSEPRLRGWTPGVCPEGPFPTALPKDPHPLVPTELSGSRGSLGLGSCLLPCASLRGLFQSLLIADLTLSAEHIAFNNVVRALTGACRPLTHPGHTPG